MAESTVRNIVFIIATVSVILLAVNLVLVIPLFSTAMVGQQASEGTVRSVSPSVTQGTGSQNGTISVTGTGTAKAPPDRAIVSFTVVTQANTAHEAQANNAVKMDGVVKALKTLGLLDNQTKTTGYSLSPIWVYPKEGGEPYISGYSCSNTVEATVKNTKLVGDMIDAAVSAGANQVSSITFTVSDSVTNQMGIEALATAVKDAQLKAETIAEAAGLVLGKPISISFGYITSVTTRGLLPVAAVGETTTPVLAPEEISVTVSVSVVYGFT